MNKAVVALEGKGTQKSRVRLFLAYASWPLAIATLYVVHSSAVIVRLNWLREPEPLHHLRGSLTTNILIFAPLIWAVCLWGVHCDQKRATKLENEEIRFFSLPNFLNTMLVLWVAQTANLHHKSLLFVDPITYLTHYWQLLHYL